MLLGLEIFRLFHRPTNSWARSKPLEVLQHCDCVRTIIYNVRLPENNALVSSLSLRYSSCCRQDKNVVGFTVGNQVLAPASCRVRK